MLHSSSEIVHETSTLHLLEIRRQGPCSYGTLDEIALVSLLRPQSFNGTEGVDVERWQLFPFQPHGEGFAVICHRPLPGQRENLSSR